MIRVYVIVVGMMMASVSFANCDLSEFNWSCNMRMQLKPTATARMLVYCGDVYGYLTQEQYDILRRYQEADVNVVLKINDEFVTAPCMAD